mgnify:CR=1 FL=1
MKELVSSFDSKQPNNTLEEIMMGFKEKSEKAESRVKVLESCE